MLNSSEILSLTIPLKELITGQLMPDVDDSNDAYTDTGSSVENNGLGTV